MIDKMLGERKLPPFKEREEMLDVLLPEEYGYLPEKPESISFKETDDYIINFCAGKAVSRKVEVTCNISGKEFTFPFHAAIPKREGKRPFFVMINFRDNVPDRYMPTEEIIDNGFAVLSFCYEDVTHDNGDFTDGLSGVLFENGERKPSDPGKIAMWAWAAQRVMDYAETLNCLDFENSIVCGHSRLGKTALLTGATDSRFKFVFSNDSGCSGAALSRGKSGERIEDICNTFGYWFCENYKKYMGKEDKMPFDQHYLAALIAPRYLYIASAKEDLWADPDSEFLNCCAVSEVYEKCGEKGFIHNGRFPEAGEEYHEGSIGYHKREGLHYFSREDWNRFIKFVNQHKG